MSDPFPLQTSLNRLARDASAEVKLPACPDCGRTVRLDSKIHGNGEALRASIWIWCDACCQAAAVFDVSPVPPWLKA